MRWRLPKYFIAASAVGSFIGGTVLLRDVIVGNPKKLDSTIRADGKVIIVTGSNTGIGKETVREFAKRGAKVYMACRNMTLCNEARAEIIKDTLNKNIYCRACDLADFNSIQSFVSEFKSRESKLDVLVNNAGVMRTPKLKTKQGIEIQLGVNHMGHFLLTHLLLDYLKASAPSRIVVVSSIAHSRGKLNFDDLNSENNYSPDAAYNQSKLANMLFVKHLSKQLEGSKVTVNAVNPGLVYTELGRHMGLENSYLAKVFVKPVLKFFLKTPVQGSITSVYVSLEPSLESVSGKYFSDSDIVIPSADANDEKLARQLWLTSLKWTENYHNISAKSIVS